MANRLYTDEFKQEAVNQIIKNGYPIKDTAQRLGVHPDSLKAELKRVTEERDILKKAAAYFAKNQK